MKTKLNGFLTLLLVLFVQISFAQEKTVTGKVADASGPLPGVTVVVKGTNTGTQSDFDGNYSIKAKPGAVLQFSFIGMTTVEKTVGASNKIDVTMIESAEALDEVVVTALGIKRDKKSLGYATQEIKGDAVSTAKDPNFVNSLSGKIAGIDVKSSGTMGGSTNVVMRGYSSLYNSNQALFVVDGVPVSNINSNSSDQSTGRGGYDFGNAAQDINPDDIESVNVLKGGAATALYGSRAANGVIVITTKKGKNRDNKGIGVTINTSVTFNKYNSETMAQYQKEYGAGYSDYYYDAGGPRGGGFFVRDLDGDGIDDLTTPSTEDASFGAAFDPSLSVYQWDSWYPQLGDTYLQATPWEAAKNDPNSYFKVGSTIFKSVALDGANEEGNFRLGYTKLNQEGILENSSIIRDNVDFGGSYKLTDKLTASAKATYVKTKGKGRYGTGYDSNNPMQAMRQWWQTNVDVKEQRAAYFATRDNITWNSNDPLTDLSPIYSDNPYWTRYENYETDSRNRVFGNFTLNYEINDWLSAMGRVTLDTYSGIQEERINVGSVDISKYSRFNESFTENNFDFMLNFNKDLSEKINLRAVLGSNIQTTRYSNILSSTNGGLSIARLYALSNSAGTLLAPDEYEYHRRTDGYYANVSLDFDNLIFVEGSYRYDTASTLPTDNNAYSYYGASGSFLFSSLLESNAIQLGKLRVGYAKTGNSARPLSVYDTYVLGDNVGGQPIASLPSTKNNNNLKNEISNEIEVGLEMAFLKNRLGFDLSVYNKTSEDLITPASITGATGYTRQWINAGEIENKGVELSLYGSPVKTDDFEWKVNVNWGQNKSEVLSLPDGLDNLQLTSLQGGVSINATIGEAYGQIKGSDFVYVDGEKVVNQDTGYYEKTASTSENLGSFQADWKGGINNSFRYKNLSFSFLIDVQKGGNIFSLDTWYGYATGLYDFQAGTNDLGNEKRISIADGGGIILPGVAPDGTANEVRSRYDYYAHGEGYTRAPNAMHVYDASYVKLREVSLAYTFPKNLFKNSFIENLTVTATGRNLWIIDKNTPYTDPEAGLSSGNVQGYQSGAYPSTKDYGFNIKLEF
ncbi:TonB-linked outer membrane protein, SusC/RagA family [Lutibacter oricola]|uniref:TonB-linked outer membrane protein, SusC/RagA family n=1 Tax=Lutibacter oricola TaxID=762486 RepID=A0A1H2Z2G2_9FLAO|nr:SusC/RagA family TonB-linked outer membrane protein [Lutibacter oricola]SDX11188.1 TonB-linked outer membrane protein, SusC/RagA family [Lutibacter oricola]